MTVPEVETGLYIDGKWTAAEGGRTGAVENPATGEEPCRVADASPADAERALAGGTR